MFSFVNYYNWQHRISKNVKKGRVEINKEVAAAETMVQYCREMLLGENLKINSIANLVTPYPNLPDKL